MKNFLIITRHAPYGTSFGREALDVVLMASAFAQVSLLFLDDGIFQIQSGQRADTLEIKDYSPTFRVLKQYDVKNIYVSSSAMKQRGLVTNDLLLDADLVSDSKITKLLQEHDVVLSF